MALLQFLLPDLGEGLEDAEVASWRVAEGDRVALNQTLVEVNTAKALVEIPAPWKGVVEKLHASEGEVVKVGQPLVSIRVEEDAGETDLVPEAAAGASQQAAQQVGAADAEQVADEAEQRAEAGRPRRRPVLVGYGVEEEEAEPPVPGPPATARQGPVPASPPVRRLAKELGVDLSEVSGSGPGGRVTREDITKAAASAGEPSEPTGPAMAQPAGMGHLAVVTQIAEVDRSIPVRGTRRLIAEKMTRSVREIPHVTTFLTVDASSVQAFRQELGDESEERISPLPIIVRALIETSHSHPKLNSSFIAADFEIALYRTYNIGIATDTGSGLMVPVVKDAGRMGILELSREITRLSEAARSGSAKLEEMVGSTVTVSNVGTFGAEFGTPIINHPEAAIVAIGVIEPRALVVEGRVEARPAMTLSLSFDHRVMDGAEAGRALKDLKGLLENPFRLGALPR